MKLDLNPPGEPNWLSGPEKNKGKLDAIRAKNRHAFLKARHRLTKGTGRFKGFLDFLTHWKE